MSLRPVVAVVSIDSKPPSSSDVSNNNVDPCFVFFCGLRFSVASAMMAA